MSAKKRRELAERRPIREAVFERDGHRCVLALVPGAGECFGHLTPHHLLKASAGGLYEPGNLITLCAASNDWVEDNPERAHALGLVMRPGETEADCWERMRAMGLVTYGPDGVSIVRADRRT